MIENTASKTFEKIERNGRLLCSPRNPMKEAAEWLQRQKLTVHDQAVLVLGLGAGYHVQELCRQFPNLKVEIFELDPQFRNSQYHFVEEPFSEKYDAILAFRPAWAGYEAQYLTAYLKLTGRDQNPDQQFLNQQDELKIWQSLRELIK